MLSAEHCFEPGPADARRLLAHLQGKNSLQAATIRCAVLKPVAASRSLKLVPGVQYSKIPIHLEDFETHVCVMFAPSCMTVHAQRGWNLLTCSRFTGCCIAPLSQDWKHHLRLLLQEISALLVAMGCKIGKPGWALSLAAPLAEECD